MPQTKEGAAKTAAKVAGLTVTEYLRRISAGKKRCIACKDWKRLDAFGRDSSRSDGRAATCQDCRKKRYDATYVPTARPLPGRSYVAPRDGDKQQARGRINSLIKVGIIPAPNALPCALCGHKWKPGERRHEYDHHLGYAAVNHEKVRALCTTCHKKNTPGYGGKIRKFCLRGHPMNAGNLILEKKGKTRRCRICRNCQKKGV